MIILGLYKGHKWLIEKGDRYGSIAFAKFNG